MTRIEPIHTRTVQEHKSRKDAQGVRAKSFDFSAIFAQLSAGAVLNSARNGARALPLGQYAKSRAGQRAAQQSNPRAALRAPATKSLRSASSKAGQVDAKELLTQSRQGSPREQLRGRAVQRYEQRPEAIDRGAVLSRAGRRASDDLQPGDARYVNRTPGAGQAAQDRHDAEQAQGQTGQGGTTRAEAAGSVALAAGDAAAVSGGRNASQAGVLQAIGRLGATGSLLTGGAGNASQALSGAMAGGQADAHGNRAGLNSAGTSKQAGLLRGQQTSEIFKNQLMHGLGAALRKGRGAVTLRLRPSSLGELTIRLRMNGDAVEAKISATTDQAHQLLEQSKDSLRTALEARGLHAQRIEIVLERSQAQGFGQSASETHNQGELGQPGAQGYGAGGGDKPATEQQDGRANPVRIGSEINADAEKNFSGEVEMEVELPGIVYGVADGAVRLVRVDALA